MSISGATPPILSVVTRLTTTNSSCIYIFLHVVAYLFTHLPSPGINVNIALSTFQATAGTSLSHKAALASIDRVSMCKYITIIYYLLRVELYEMAKIIGPFFYISSYT